MQELEEKAKASEGYRIYTKIRALQGSYHVFEGNYHNLVWALEEFRKPDVIDELWRVDNREGLDGFLREIARIFHNYLSGAKTLVDHTRVFKGEMYSGTSFEIEYQNRVNKDLKDSPIVQFVQNLRNYTLS